MKNNVSLSRRRALVDTPTHTLKKLHFHVVVAREASNIKCFTVVADMSANWFKHTHVRVLRPPTTAFNLKKKFFIFIIAFKYKFFIIVNNLPRLCLWLGTNCSRTATNAILISATRIKLKISLQNIWVIEETVKYNIMFLHIVFKLQVSINISFHISTCTIVPIEIFLFVLWTIFVLHKITACLV